MRVVDSYVCIDLETTGLDPKRDKIIEIGAVRVEGGQVRAQWESLVNPGRKLEERIVELTGICDQQLADAPKIEQVLPAFHDFTKDQVILGHSVLFDFSFIKKASVDGRMKFERYGIDTLKIARKYLQELESRSLGSLCAYYGISHNAHRALADAMATVALYDRLVEHFFDKEAQEGDKSLFLPKPLLYQVKRDTPLTIPQKEQLYKLADKHKLILDYQIESLTRSEASRKIYQLLAEYGR